MDTQGLGGGLKTPSEKRRKRGVAYRWYGNFPFPEWRCAAND